MCEKVNYSQAMSIVCVGVDEKGAESLMNSLFKPELKDGVYHFTINGQACEGYLKYPGPKVSSYTAGICDALLVNCPSGDPKEEEIMNYAHNRKDAPYRIVVEDKPRTLSDQHVRSMNAKETTTLLDSLAKQYTEWVKSLDLENGGDEYRFAYEKYKYNTQARKDKRFVHLVGVPCEQLKNAKKCLDDLASNTDPSKLVSDQNCTFEVSPENVTPNGLGVEVDVISGTEFDKKNPCLPMVVRDSLCNVSLELVGKSEEEANNMHKALRELREQYLPMLEAFEDGSKMFSLSLSQDKCSVFVDATINGQYGEVLQSAFKNLHVEQHNYNLSEKLKFQTNLSLTDLLTEEPNPENVTSKLFQFALSSKGRFTNLRVFFHLIREFSKYVKRDKQKQACIMISTFLNLMTCFTNTNCKFNFGAEEINDTLWSMVDSYLGGTDNRKTYLQGFLETWSLSMFPMGLAMLENFRSFYEPYINTMKGINFDRISAQITLPWARTEVNAIAFLTGLTKVVEDRVLNK